MFADVEDVQANVTLHLYHPFPTDWIEADVPAARLVIVPADTSK
jgi:hypothetical protein